MAAKKTGKKADLPESGNFKLDGNPSQIEDVFAYGHPGLLVEAAAHTCCNA